MEVEKLYLKNFLSYGEQTAEFYSGLNIITGANACGKTNLLDSVYIAAIGKGSRDTKDKDFIKWGEKDGARVRVLVKKKFEKRIIEIFINGRGEKCVAMDEIPISRMGELMGGITVVLFSPDELKLIKESPANRRRFLDISLSQQSKTYFYALVKYNKLLAQRNKVLKDYKGNAAINDMLEIVEEQLIPQAEFIIKRRKDFVERLAEKANLKHGLLTGGKETLELCYETEAVDFENISESLKKIYLSLRERDIRLEYTSAGIHRDDIGIVAGGIDVRKFGSQGQQRTAVLSMKLAECGLHFENNGEYPVLLLDDVFSELDTDRQSALLKAADGMQTLVTCTEFDERLACGTYKLIKIGENKILTSEMKNYAKPQ